MSNAPRVFMSQHTIDDLEHRSGLRPLVGEYPDHCDHCALVANCEHENVTALSRLCGGTTRVCSGCGQTL